MSGPTVTSYSQPTPHLLSLLSSRLPNSLPLLRRLQFTRFPGGVTEHSRILYAGASALSETTADDYAGAVPTNAPFAAAYVDLSRGPETEVYFYSSLESLTGTPLPEQIREAGDHASALLKSVRAVRDEYDAGGAAKRAQAPVLIGTLSETVRRLLLARGFVCTYCTIWDKWIFRLDGLPDAALARVDAAMEKQGLRWGKIVSEDTGLVLSRTKIPRTKQVPPVICGAEG
ncbi:GNAT family protein [Seiridium cupressi]